MSKAPTHKQLFEHLISDENIQDNIDVSDDYENTKNGNSIITMGFEGTGTAKKKGTHCVILLEFDKDGRLFCMEVATRKKGEKNWQVASSEKFVDFKPRLGNDAIQLSDRKKLNN
jgi:hypothetical protein